MKITGQMKAALRALAEREGSALWQEMGITYPVLHALEKEKLVKGDLRDDGFVITITDAGRAAIGEEVKA